MKFDEVQEWLPSLDLPQNLVTNLDCQAASCLPATMPDKLAACLPCCLACLAASATCLPLLHMEAAIALTSKPASQPAGDLASQPSPSAS